MDSDALNRDELYWFGETRDGANRARRLFISVRCLRHCVNMRPRLGFPYPEEAGLAPLWAAGVAPEGKDEKTAPTEAVGCILPAGREGNMEILVKATIANIHKRRLRRCGEAYTCRL
jgi:hypothetical protein